MVDGTLLHSVENGEIIIKRPETFYELTGISRYFTHFDTYHIWGWMSFTKTIYSFTNFRECFFDVKLLYQISGWGDAEIFYISR